MFRIFLFIKSIVIGVFSLTSQAVIIESPIFSYFQEPKYSVGFKQFDYIDSTAKKSGLLKLVSDQDFNTLNPFSYKGTYPESLIPLTTASLGKKSLDDNKCFYAYAAAFFKWPTNYAWLEITLRENLQFSNGDIIEAEDIVESVLLFEKNNLKRVQATPLGIKKINFISSNQIRFEFKQTNFYQNITSVLAAPIFSKENIEHVSQDEAINNASASSGPYQVEAFIPNEKIIYSRVKDFWGKNLNVNLGQYNFNIIEVTVDPDKKNHSALLMQKKINLLTNLNNQQSSSKLIPRIKRKDYIKKTELLNETPYNYYLTFNLKSKKLKSQSIRKALILLINNNKLITENLNSLEILSSLKQSANQKGQDNELALLHQQRIKLAEKYLLEAGLFKKHDQWYDQDGNYFDLKITLSDRLVDNFASEFVNELTRLGISTSLSKISTYNNLQLEESDIYFSLGETKSLENKHGFDDLISNETTGKTEDYKSILLNNNSLRIAFWSDYHFPEKIIGTKMNNTDLIILGWQGYRLKNSTK